jgi:hypothetical protein
MRIQNLFDQGSGIFLTLDLGYKNSDPGSRIRKTSLMHRSVIGILDMEPIQIIL